MDGFYSGNNKSFPNFAQKGDNMIENWPDKKYNIIYADPPWSYYNDSTAKQNCTTVRGMRRPPYPVMGSKDIMALPVKDIADENCILFCWTTDYHLSKCLDVMKAWGFEYKTVGFVWSKRNKDNSPVCFMGAYTMKSGVELCLIGTKGNGATKMVINHKVRSYIESIREQHSKKPDQIRNRITELVGDLPRIELFARQKTEGWDVWGNEV